MNLKYNTRGADGNDITKEIAIKKYPSISVRFICMCGKECTEGIPVKKIVSSNFTEWGLVSEYVCEHCADLFSLYFNSYILNSDGIRLLNVREMAEEIQKPQKPSFKIIISVSQKKHLFYKAVYNDNPDRFIANLEEERISCDLDTLREQFLFVGSLQALGESKERLKTGEIRHDILIKTGHAALNYLQEQLKTRQIQIPLHLSQKLNILSEDAICNLNLILSR